MSATARLNDLANRKRLLVAEADLHRQILGVERLRLRLGASVARDFASSHCWWLSGGAVVVGLLLARRWRSIAGAVPAVAAVWRAFR